MLTLQRLLHLASMKHRARQDTPPLHPLNDLTQMPEQHLRRTLCCVSPAAGNNTQPSSPSPQTGPAQPLCGKASGEKEGKDAGLPTTRPHFVHCLCLT